MLLVSVVVGGGGGHGRVGGATAAAASASVSLFVAAVAGVQVGDDSSSVQSLLCSHRHGCNRMVTQMVMMMVTACTYSSILRSRAD